MKVYIVEDNVETLGVLRDFVRATDPAIEVKTFTSGNSLLEKDGRVQADLLILGYDLGPSVTGTELLHYLQWSDRISAKTHVVFISNTLELARRQAPLRFTHTRFIEKPISIGHLQDSIAWMSENQSVFSSVFYLIDKQKWQAAFNSLQLCKENCPLHLQQQAWLLECMLLLKLRAYAKVIRRYQLTKSYDWAGVIKLWALMNLGQLKAGRHVFNGMAAHDAYYSSALALVNQLTVAAHTQKQAFIPESLKESELSLFECELKASLLVQKRGLNEALVYLHAKQKRTKRGSHQAYFYAVAVLKACLLQVFKEPTANSVGTVVAHMQPALNTALAQHNARDKELNEILWPNVIEALEAGTVTAASPTSLKIGALVEDASPISLLVRMYLHWISTGELCVNQLEGAIELIERQGASGRAVCNQLLLENMFSMMVADPRQQLRVTQSLATRLSKQGRYEQAAYALSRALQIEPDSESLHKKLAWCCKHLEVKQFLEHN